MKKVLAIKSFLILFLIFNCQTGVNKNCKQKTSKNSNIKGACLGFPGGGCEYTSQTDCSVNIIPGTSCKEADPIGACYSKTYKSCKNVANSYCGDNVKANEVFYEKKMCNQIQNH